MEKIDSFKNLIVWQKSMTLAKEVYEVSRTLPATEAYALISQIQRAVVSIPSNIAEGTKRSSRKDFANFLRMAVGSAAELETQLLLIDSIYPKSDTKKAKDLLIEIEKMLSVFIKRLSN